MTEQELKTYLAAIRGADEAAMAAARRRQAALAKPPGSLGKLEDMAVRMAGVTGRVCPPMNRCRVAVFAADNGVVDEGVSCTPRSVTVQQAINMTRRKTGMSAMEAVKAGFSRASISIIDSNLTTLITAFSMGDGRAPAEPVALNRQGGSLYVGDIFTEELLEIKL